MTPSEASGAPDMNARRQERDARPDDHDTDQARAEERGQVTRERASQDRVQSCHDAGGCRQAVGQVGETLARAVCKGSSVSLGLMPRQEERLQLRDDLQIGVPQQVHFP